MKRMLAPLLALLLLAGCGQASPTKTPASVSVPGTASAPAAATSKLSAAKSGKLTIVLTDCNGVSIQEKAGAPFSFDGAEADFTTVYTPEEGTLRITQRDKEESFAAVLTVSPEVYATIRVEAEDSALNLRPQSANYELKAGDCAVEGTFPAAYSGTFYTNLTDCAVSFSLSRQMKNLRLTLDAKNSAVSVPETWTYLDETPFTLTRGTAGALLDFKLQDCAAGFGETSVDIVSRWPATGARSIMMSNNKAELYLGAPGEHSDNWTVQDQKWERESARAAAKPGTDTPIKTVPAAGVTALRVEANLCGVVLEPSKSGAFELSYVGVENTGDIAVTTAVQGGTLTLTAQGSDGQARYINTTPEKRINCVRLGVPQGALSTLSIDNGTAIIASYGLTLPPVTGFAGSGMVLLNTDTLSAPVTMGASNGCAALTAKAITAAVDLEAKNGSVAVTADTVSAPVTLQVANGSVKLEAGTVTGKVSLSSQNGSVDASLDKVADAVIKADNGSVTATLGTITGDVSCSVKNGSLFAELTRYPTDLTFHLTGGWENKNRTWDHWADDKDDDWYWDEKEGKDRPDGLPDGWYDGLVIGSGKPTLTLGAFSNGYLSFAVPKK